MKENKNKRKIIILILVILVCLPLLIYLFIKINTYKITVKKETINYCLSRFKCYPLEKNYYKFSANKNIEEVDKKLDEYNKIIEDSKEKSKNSNFESAKCLPYKSTYRYSTGYNYDYKLYTSSNYISLTLYKYTINYCTENMEATEDIYKFIYSIKDKKFLTNQDIIKKINMSSKDILEFIHSKSTEISDTKNVNSYDFIINNDGNIYVSYLDKDGTEMELDLNKKID